MNKISILVFLDLVFIVALSFSMATYLADRTSYLNVVLWLLGAFSLISVVYFFLGRVLINQSVDKLSYSLMAISRRRNRNFFIPNSMAKISSAIQFHFEKLMQDNEQLFSEVQDLQTICDSILNTQDELVFLIDKDGYISYRNRAFDKTFGTPSLDFSNESFNFSENMSLLMQQISSLLLDEEQSDQTQNIQTQINIKGEIKYFSWSLKRIVDLEPIQTLFVGRDETEELQARKKTEQLEKIATVGRAASTIFHEINQPLSIIQLSTFFIKNAIESLDRNIDEEIRNELVSNSNLIESQINRSNQIIKNLRLFHSRGRKNLLFEAVLTNELINESVSVVKNEAEKNGINITVKSSYPCEQSLNGNKTLYIQVLVNILQNAIHALQRDDGYNERSIVVSTKTTASNFIIDIEDNGPGIPENELALVTEPFFSTKEEGSGLGLALCLDILNSYGGHLEIKNILPRGLLITVSFPLVINSP